MLKISFLLLICLFIFQSLSAQNKIEWAERRILTVNDFQAIPPNTGTMQTIQVYAGVGFTGMTGYTWMLAKNFNKYVTCYFMPSSSWLDKGDSTNTITLVKYAQAYFDLQELAARKLRKKMKDEKANLTATNISVYHQEIMTEITAIQSQYAKETNFASIELKQKEWESKITELLASYEDYCKTCKPKKK